MSKTPPAEKNVFITGGGRGIGRTVVLKFVAEGWGVAFTYGSQKAMADETLAAAEALRPGAKIKAYGMELKNPDQIEKVCDQAIKDFGTITAVVNNAATLRNGAAVMMSNEDWNEVISVDLSGPFFVDRAFLMHMVSNRKGHFIHMSSLAAGGSSGQINYAAAKAGLDGLSQTLAKEYGRKGITSNVVTVGYVPTDMTKDHMSNQLQAFWLEHCPAKRVGTAEEVAALVHFLTTEPASFISGENIRLTAGLTYAP